MKHVHFLLVRDLLGLGLVLLFVFCGISLVLDGVELLNVTTDKAWEGKDILAWLLMKLPIALYSVLPVVMAVSAVVVLRRWRQNGRLVSLLAVGVAPTRILSLVGVAGALLSLFVVCTHEVVIPRPENPTVRVEEWVEVVEEKGLTYVMVGDSVGSQLLDVRVVRVMDGKIVAYRTAPTMQIKGHDWYGAERETLEMMPDMKRWRASAIRLGPSMPIRVLATANPSLGRSASLIERVLTPLFVSLLAVIAGAFSMLIPRHALIFAILMSGFGQLVFRSVLAIAGRGSWPISAALGVALVPAILAVVWLLLRLERGRE